METAAKPSEHGYFATFVSWETAQSLVWPLSTSSHHLPAPTGMCAERTCSEPSTRREQKCGARTTDKRGRSAQAAMADSDVDHGAPSSPSFPFVEVIGPDGKTKRFANGTRAGFAVERFNKLNPNDSKPVVCIQAYKEGEEPIEFGPDVELILYDKAWILQSVSEYVFPIPDINVEAGTETIQTQTVEKELYKWSASSQAPWEINEDVAKTLLDKTTPADVDIHGARGWEEFYPGGVLPEGGKQECTPEYLTRVLLMFLCIFGFAGALGYFLDRMPEMLPKYNTIEPS